MVWPAAVTRVLARLRPRPELAQPPAGPITRLVDVRITRGLFGHVRAHVEDFRRGEEAGFLICSLSRLDDRDILLAREWHPIPDSAIERRAHGRCSLGAPSSTPTSCSAPSTSRRPSYSSIPTGRRRRGSRPMTAPRSEPCSAPSAGSSTRSRPAPSSSARAMPPDPFGSTAATMSSIPPAGRRRAHPRLLVFGG